MSSPPERAPVPKVSSDLLSRILAGLPTESLDEKAVYLLVWMQLINAPLHFAAWLFDHPVATWTCIVAAAVFSVPAAAHFFACAWPCTQRAGLGKRQELHIALAAGLAWPVQQSLDAVFASNYVSVPPWLLLAASLTFPFLQVERIEHDARERHEEREARRRLARESRRAARDAAARALAAGAPTAEETPTPRPAEATSPPPSPPAAPDASPSPTRASPGSSGPTRARAREQLELALCDACSEDAFRRWIRGIDADPYLWANLPGGHVSLRELVHQGVTMLGQRGRLDPDLIDRLATEHPAARPRILAAARDLFGR